MTDPADRAASAGEARAPARWTGPSTHDRACRWYLARGGETHGPLSYDALVDKARRGELRRSDHVWRSGFEDWIAVTVRPDLVAPMPARPHLGVVPESLEAAAALPTDEVRWSRDVLEAAPLADGATDGEPAFEGTTDLGALEDLALGQLIAPRDRAPTTPLRGNAAVRLADDGRWNGEQGGNDGDPPRAALALALGAPVTPRALDPEDGTTDLESMWMEVPSPLPSVEDHSLGARGRAVAVVFLLVVASALLLWSFTGRVDAALGRMTPLEPPAPRELQEIRYVDPAGTLARAVSRTTPQPSESFAWLNEAPEPTEAAPARSRPAPRRYRVAEAAARRATTPVEAPARSVLPNRLSDDLVGSVVGGAASAFGRCALHDRLSSRVPAGTELRLSVDGEGAVARARVRGVSGAVGRCLVRVARQLTFPRALESTSVAVAFGGGGTVRPRVVD